MSNNLNRIEAMYRCGLHAVPPSGGSDRLKPELHTGSWSIRRESDLTCRWNRVSGLTSAATGVKYAVQIVAWFLVPFGFQLSAQVSSSTPAVQLVLEFVDPDGKPAANREIGYRTHNPNWNPMGGTAATDSSPEN